jgi:hypothetical protein
LDDQIFCYKSDSTQCLRNNAHEDVNIFLVLYGLSLVKFKAFLIKIVGEKGLDLVELDKNPCKDRLYTFETGQKREKELLMPV